MKAKERISNKPEGWRDAGWKVPAHLTIKQERYAWKAIGVARFTFNLACATHAFHRVNRMRWPFVSDIQKAFNACNREDYPYSSPKSASLWRRAAFRTSSGPSRIGGTPTTRRDGPRSSAGRTATGVF